MLNVLQGTVVDFPNVGQTVSQIYTEDGVCEPPDTHIHPCVCVCEKGLMKGDILHPQSVAKNFTGTQLCNRVTELLLSTDAARHRECMQARGEWSAGAWCGQGERRGLFGAKETSEGGQEGGV